MQSEENDLRQRTKEFGLQIVRMFSGLPKTTEAQVLGKQVLRSGTSIGANYREAYRARSRAEWSEWGERHARQRREGSGE
jgi:four helix bundle protein